MSNFVEDEASVTEPVSTSSGHGRDRRGRGGRGRGAGRGRMNRDGVDAEILETGRGQHRRFRWTLFNYTDDHIRTIQAVDRWDMFHVRYMCYQHEICPTTGSPHLQGYAEFNRQVHWGTLKSMIAMHISIRTCDKSGHVNRAYCMKNQAGAHGFWEHGKSMMEETSA
jgi:Putative viral replication protein